MNLRPPACKADALPLSYPPNAGNYNRFTGQSQIAVHDSLFMLTFSVVLHNSALITAFKPLSDNNCNILTGIRGRNEMVRNVTVIS